MKCKSGNQHGYWFWKGLLHSVQLFEEDIYTKTNDFQRASFITYQTKDQSSSYQYLAEEAFLCTGTEWTIHQ